MNISSTSKNTRATFFGYILDRTIFINLIRETFSLEFLTCKNKNNKKIVEKRIIKEMVCKNENKSHYLINLKNL